MDIELSKIRNKASGYQRLRQQNDNDGNDYKDDNASSPGSAMSSLTRRTRGYSNSKGNKGKGKARYQDEPEDEVNLLNNADRDEFAEDDVEAEAGQSQNTRKPPPVSIYIPKICVPLTSMRPATADAPTYW